MANFFRGVRQNGEIVVMSVNATNGVVCSNGFSRPKDVNRFVKANGSLPVYLKMLLALQSEPVMTTETEFKDAKKAFIGAEKASAINRMVPEGDFNEDVCRTMLDGLYIQSAAKRAEVREIGAEIQGLAKYISSNGTKTAPMPKGPTKAESVKTVKAMLAKGEMPSAELLAKAGFMPKAA